MKRYSLLAFVLVAFLLPTAVSAQFTPGATFDTANTFDMVVADFNGDSIPDVFSANRYQGGVGQGVNTLFIGDGNGGLTQVAQPNFVTEYGSVGVAALDADGDNDLDIFVANGSESCDPGQCGPNELWLNDGSGVFTLGQLPGSQTGWDVETGDFDGNGLMDVAVTGDPVIDVYMQRTGGTFDLYSVTYSSFPSSGGKLEVADFTGDTIPDIAVVKGDNGWKARVYENTTTQDPQNINNNSAFTAAQPFEFGPLRLNPNSFTSADFNGDGDMDVAIGGTAPSSENGQDHLVDVWLNPGNGQFSALSPDFSNGSRNNVRFRLNAADINDDGNADILAAGFNWGYANQPFNAILFGDGSGQIPDSFSGSIADRVLVSADMNGDGRPDLIAGNSQGTSNRIYLQDASLTVRTADDSGLGSLRGAIEYANATANGLSADEIAFDIQGAGPHIIALLSELTVTDPILVDGITQSGATCGLAPSGRDLRIGVESSPAAPVGTSSMRLMPTASGSTIRGLAFGTSQGFGLILDGAGNSTVECNFIGTETDGTTLGEIRDVGLQVSAATGNVIGGASTAEGNVITGAVDAALWISGGSGNTVRHNIIGLNKFGSAILAPNNGGDIGINVVQSPNTIVDNNQIGGFGGVAVQVDNSSAPDISFNYIGTNANWSGTFPNGIGVRLSNNTDDGRLLLNYITGSTGNAVEVLDATSTGNQIINNSIYLNQGLAIDLGGDGATSNDPGDTDIGPNDLINYPENIVAEVNASGQLVLSWDAGTPVSTNFTTEFYKVDNNGSGAETRVYAATQSSANPSLVAGPAAGLGVAIGDQLVVSHSEFPTGNTSEFSPVVTVIGPFTVNNTNDSGPGSLRQAVLNANASANVGGQPDEITFAIPGAGPHTITLGSELHLTEAVVIDGYSQAGSSANTTAGFAPFDAIIQIHVDGSGIGSGNAIRFSGHSDSEIRGLVVYGSPDLAISLDGGGHKVIGSFIGSDGVTYLGSGGIHLQGGNDDEIGGPNPADRNLILDGVKLEPSVNSPLIQGNYFGLKANGTEIFTSGRPIIGIASNQATFVEVRDNVLAGATQRGIGIAHANASQGPRNWSVINNRLGTDHTGTSTLPSGNTGIYVYKGAHDNLFQNNIIAGHSLAGILITQAAGDFSPLRNQISQNSMFGNGTGIDLTPHASGGTDSNDGILAPTIGNAEISPSGELTIVVTGDRNGTIEFFEADSQNKEGQRYFNSTAYSSAGSQTNVIIADPTAAGISDGDNIIATLTDEVGNTSEFSVPFIVTTVVANPLVVSNTDDSGLGSLRNAIEAANSTPGTDTITFDLTGGDVYTISPASGLPQITESVTIDGLSQTNATCGTTDFTDRALKIVLDGSSIGYVPGGPSGLQIADGTGGVVVQGLVIHSFPGAGVFAGQGSNGNVIRCNYIGTDETGTVAQGNFGNGITIVGYTSASTGTTIGGPAVTDGNLISANGSNEIHFEPGGDDNTIANNLIGTNATGTATLQAPNGYFGDPGIDNFSNLVGLGSNQGARNTISGNVFGGFGNAIEVVSRFFQGTGQAGGATILQGNFIGTDQTGAINLGNNVGVSLSGDAAALGSEVVGGSNPTHANVIANNGFAGILIQGGAPDHVIEGNVIQDNGSGVFLNGTSIDVSILGNLITSNNTGVLVDASDRTVIRDNTISGNQGNGVLLRNGADDTTILLNRIGVGTNGQTAQGNTAAGIWVETSQNTLIQENVVSGNGDSGIVLTGGSSDNMVLNNIAGLDVSGSVLVPNSREGLAITTGSHTNTVSGNIFSGNLVGGVVLWESGAGNVLTSNFIGTGPGGVGTFGNVGHGVRVGMEATAIIGQTGQGNVIAHNGRTGILVTDSDGAPFAKAFISENSIFDNGTVGIDLLVDDTGTPLDDDGDGRNDNDPGDSDAGPNGLMNTPVFNWLLRNSSTVDMELFIDSPLPATVEVFVADADNEEGQTLLGTTVANTNRVFLSYPTSSVPNGSFLVATSTGPDGTSEFSPGQPQAAGSELALIPDQVIGQQTVLDFKLSPALNAIPGMNTAMQAAVASWLNVSTAEAAAHIRYDGVGTVSDANVSDGQNVITISSPQFPLSSNTLAVASKLLIAPAGGSDQAQIATADIIFNADLIGDPNGIGTDDQQGIWDAQAVATHEFGHTLGMRHSGVSTATMFFSIPSGLSYRSLEVDDIAWISHRYPSQAAAGLGSISGTIMDGEALVPTPVAGALVVARNVAGERVHSYTNELGEYTIPGLPPATYEISIQPLSGLVDNIPGMSPGTVSPYLQSIANNATFSREKWSGGSESGTETTDVAEPVLVLTGQHVGGIDFTTNLDTTPPTVNGVTPGGDRVAQRPEIAATFSEPIGIAGLQFTVMNTEIGTLVPGTVQVPGGTGVVATFTLAAGVLLEHGITYEISVSGATDGKGNVNATPFTRQFKVRPADIFPPVISKVSPTDASTGIGTNTTFVLTFDEPLVKASVETGVVLECVGGTCSTGTPVAGTFSFPTSSVVDGLPGWSVVFKPAQLLNEGASYLLTAAAGLTDLSGNALGTASTFQFTTQTNVAPGIVNHGPTGSSVSTRTSIFADFNERMILPSLTAGVTLTGPGNAPVEGTAELLEEGKRIIFRPDAPLAHSTPYTVTFNSSITDASVPPLELDPFSFNFTTAPEPVAVSVESITPLFAIPGALVSLGGTGFNPDKSANSITFSGKEGPIQATVENATLTSISAIVPEGAVTGPVTVTSGSSSGSIILELYDVLPLIDPAVARTTTESAPRDVEVSPDGGTAYVTNTGGNTVSVLDVATGEQIATIEVGLAPLKVVLSPDATLMYVTNFASNSVSVIDTGTLTVLHTIDVGLNPFGLAISPDGKRLYVAEYTSQKISIIDLDQESGTANRAIARISVESNERDTEVAPDGGVTLGVESNPRDVEVSPDGGTLFFTTQDLGLRYLVLDANGSADEDAATIRISQESSTRDVEVSPDGGVVWMTSLAGALEGYRIPAELLGDSQLDGSFQAVARLGEESNSREVEVSPDGGLLYVTSFDLGLVQVYAISSQIVPSSSSATGSVFALSLAPVQTIAVGDNPEAVVFSAAVQLAIVVNSGSDDVTVLRFDDVPVVSSGDQDGDGLTDDEELALGTDPENGDSDGDSLSDGQEVALGTNPLSADTDGDSLSDSLEVAGGITSPLLADTDEDGLDDAVELDPSSLTLANDPDSDGDGILDGLDPDADGSGAPDERQVVLLDFETVATAIESSPGFGKGGPKPKNNGDGDDDEEDGDEEDGDEEDGDDDEEDGEGDLIEDIREKLTANLETRLWETSMMPSEKRGSSMFSNDKNALKKLSDLAEDAPGYEAALDSLGSRLLLMDFAIVDTLLFHAQASACDSDKKCRKSLNSALSSRQDALEELHVASTELIYERDGSRDERAIDDLRKSWKSAVEAYEFSNSYGKGNPELEVAEVPVEFSLSQNYPNPFNPTTTINFALKEAVEVRLTVYDLLGRHVQTLISGPMEAGTHQIRFDASRLASGMYLYRIQAGDFVKVQRMTLMK